MVKVVREGMLEGRPSLGAPAPVTGHSPLASLSDGFPTDFLCFEVHFSFSVQVLRRDSILASLSITLVVLELSLVKYII